MTSLLLFNLLLILVGPFTVVGAIAVLAQVAGGPMRRPYFPTRPAGSFRARGLVTA